MTYTTLRAESTIEEEERQRRRREEDGRAAAAARAEGEAVLRRYREMDETQERAEAEAERRRDEARREREAIERQAHAMAEKMGRDELVRRRAQEIVVERSYGTVRPAVQTASETDVAPAELAHSARADLADARERRERALRRRANEELLDAIASPGARLLIAPPERW